MRPSLSVQSFSLKTSLPSILLFLIPFLSALTIITAKSSRGGYIVLYREPKLVAIQVLSWLFIVVVVWLSRKLFAMETLFEASQRPITMLLCGLVGYMLITFTWTKVKENAIYELNQYVLILVLLVVLDIWSTKATEKTIIWSYVLTMCVCAMVGFAQRFGATPWLPPIDPEIGVMNPSLMGYKNPMALALGGQIFLLGGMLCRYRRRRMIFVALALVLLIELLYLLELQSRTSYAAVVIAATWLTMLWWGKNRSLIKALSICIAVLALATFFSIYRERNEQVDGRVRSMVDFVVTPSNFLDSDRGTYFLNTMHMVGKNPWGVGLGDWQTQYPVYRKHNRGVSFSSEFQARRAHSDYVQNWGELGWAGLGLWSVLVSFMIIKSAQTYWNHNRLMSLFISAQMVFFAIAMCTDYLTELPYNKWQFFLIGWLASREVGVIVTRREGRQGWRHIGITVLCLTVVSGTIGGIYCVKFWQKLVLSAKLHIEYMDGVVASPERLSQMKALRDLHELGRRFDGSVGYAKTFHKDYLLLADSAKRLGLVDEANYYARKSLKLHPYYANTFRFLGSLETVYSEAERRRFNKYYTFIMERASDGGEGMDIGELVP